jgi:hypothetical protein
VVLVAVALAAALTIAYVWFSGVTVIPERPERDAQPDGYPAGLDESAVYRHLYGRRAVDVRRVGRSRKRR